MVAAPKPEPAEVLPAVEPPPSRRVQPSPYALAPKPATAAAAEFTQLGSLLAGIAGSAPVSTLDQALARSVRWERTRCYEKEGRRCKPGTRQPCKRCLDVDFPFRATIDGGPWKLRYNGKHAPFTLIVDGRELGPVAQDWPTTWRSFGAPMPELERGETEDDD